MLYHSERSAKGQWTHHCVRFPAQEHASGSSKIPTILYYDQAGEVRALGAEATNEGIFEEAEDGGWMKVEWYAVCDAIWFSLWGLQLKLGSNCTFDRTHNLPSTSLSNSLLSHQRKLLSKSSPTFSDICSSVRSPTFSKLTRMVTFYGHLLSTISTMYFLIRTAGKAFSRRKCVRPLFSQG